jgi:peptide/nickel transport system permease protein
MSEQVRGWFRTRTAARRRADSAARRAPRRPFLSLAWALLIVIMALVPGLLAPYSPLDINPVASRQPPAFMAGGAWAHPLGTDEDGRDLLSRIIFGTRTDLSIIAASLLLGGIAGASFGMLAGYAGGWIETVTMRAVDVSLALPTILLALTVVAVSGPSFWLVVLATAFVLWARFARLLRAEVVVWRERDFITAAKAAGAPDTRVLIRHIFPNVLNTVIVLSTLQIGWIIILEGSLSFLGAGVPAPTPSWGDMVATGRDTVQISWWVAGIPALMISLTVLASNVLGDWLRDRLDPRLRGGV